VHRVELPVAADLPGRLVDMVRATPWLLEALRAARDVDPPDWLVGGGVLRDLVWDAVHTWYGRVFGGQGAPLTSSADGVGTWPETATAVAVRLLPDDHVQVVAPCGLEDLFGLVCRRNPRRVSVDHYHQRVRDKHIIERWPRVEVVLEQRG
jgi:uncharacterized protein